jgi:hypothetical protein
MNSDNYEKAFDEFLESEEYERVQAAMFELTRAAFRSGWIASSNNGGDNNIVNFPPV